MKITSVVPRYATLSVVLVLVCVVIRPSSGDANAVSREIKRAGYKYELHSVPTSDGWTLGVVKIPAYGRVSDPQFPKRRGVVFLMHCLACNCGVFIAAGPERALAYALSNDGYDVYMGNQRATSFSKKHKTYSEFSPKYWDFSLDEIGGIDVPTMVDFTLRHSQEKKIHFVGFSMGGTLYLIAMSTHPQMNSVLKSTALIVPGVYIGSKVRSNVVRYLADNQLVVEDILRTLGFNGLGLTQETIDLAVLNFCSPSSSERSRSLCHSILFSFTGPGLAPTDRDKIPDFIKYSLDSISVKQLAQFGQFIETKRFQKYQYRDNQTNINVYGSSTPPEYSLANITVPIITFHGTGDHIVTTNAAHDLYKYLKSIRERHMYQDYNHFDFVMGRFIQRDVNEPVIRFFNQIDHETQKFS